MLFERTEAIRTMKKLTLLALFAAALAFPTLASAHDLHRGGWHGGPAWHGGGWHGGHAHVGFVAPFPVPVPVGYVRPSYYGYYAPAPVYVAPPVYAASAPVYYPPAPVYALGPAIAIRTPHVAISLPLPPLPF